MRIRIPFNRPALLGNEIRFIRDAIRRGQLSGDGYYTQRCSTLLEEMLGVRRVLLTPSCTHALELAFLVLQIEPGDEVLLPSFTFTSTANSFVLRGAVPKFIDIRPDTLNIDERQLAKNVSKKTKVIMPVHYAGVPCQMDVILQVARAHRLTIVEDAAQALGASFRGQLAGTFGRMNAFSFHETKNCMCGEGGVLTFHRSDDVERAQIIRQKGTDRENFFQGKVPYYSWVSVGSSYLPSELQTAYLYAQLKRMKEIRRRRERIFQRYVDALSIFEKRGHIRLPEIPRDVISSYHLFHVVFPSVRRREQVQEGLRSKGILAVVHYTPLHDSVMGHKFGYQKGDCPVSEFISPRLLRLPLYNTMRWAEQRRVIAELKKLL